MKRILTLSKSFFLVTVVFLSIIIFYNKTQYALLDGYVFERPIVGQMNVSNYVIDTNILITNKNILFDGILVEYKVIGEKWGVYNVEFINEHGEYFFRMLNFSIFDIKFHSNIDNMAMGGNGVSTSVTNNPQSNESFVYKGISSSQARLLASAVLVNVRYELLYKQLKLLVCMLFPFMCVGILLYFKPVIAEHFLLRRLFKLNQLSENSTRRLGVLVFFISLIIPFVLLYI
jgi:hypothetical protein